MDFNFDVNDLRSAVTVAGFVLFIALVRHTWSRARQGEHQAAAALPFEEEGRGTPESQPASPVR